MHLCDIVTSLYIRPLLTWLLFILNKNTIIVYMYISNLHQTCYTVLVNILVLVTMQGHLLLLLSHVVIVVKLHCC